MDNTDAWLEMWAHQYNNPKHKKITVKETLDLIKMMSNNLLYIFYHKIFLNDLYNSFFQCYQLLQYMANFFKNCNCT